MKADTREFLINTLSGRAAVYEYLSLIFREPPKETFIGLSEKFIPVFERIADESGLETLAKGAELLREYAWAEKRADKIKLLGELNSRYTALFLLGFSSIPPTASGMLTPGCVIKQEPWEKTLKVYKRWGYKMPPGFKEPEDHVYAQLRFMEKMSFLAAGLAEKDGSGLYEALSAQRDFLEENVSGWIGLFCGMLRKRADASQCEYRLYEAGAYLTEGYIAEDIKLLDMLAR